MPLPVEGDQALERLHAQGRHIPIEDEDGARLPLEGLTCLQDGVAGAELLRLQHIADAVADGGADQIRAVADHQCDGIGTQGASAGEGPQHHGLPAHGMEHLGQPRHHAGTLAGGQNDARKIAHCVPLPTKKAKSALAVTRGRLGRLHAPLSR